MRFERFLRSFPTRTSANGARVALNLALQGGGAHGAFTWGVLDRLLEDERIAIAAVSGTSAGALNAVALIDGLAADGPAGARAKLDTVWGAVAQAGRTPTLAPSLDRESALRTIDVVTRLLAPNLLNPYQVNPLRDILRTQIDFRRVRRQSAVEAFVAATDISSGRARIFRRHELSTKVVLASACLPRLMPPVRIGGRLYWDGGFSANPPLWPLLESRGAHETLVIALEPLDAGPVPATATEIEERLAWLMFAQPLAQELVTIGRAKRAAGALPFGGGRLRRHLRRHRFHFVEGGTFLASLGRASRVFPEPSSLERLKAAGRDAADAWLAARFGSDNA